MSRAYAEVIGDPIAQSKSPLIHGYWLRELGIAADYRHAHVRSADLPTYFAARRQDSDWRGCNVTMPHKEAVMPLLDALDPLAAKIGAVNTVVRAEDGRLTGYNTDAIAIREIAEALSPGAEPDHKVMVDVIGAGGAARAAMVAVGQIHPEITVWAREQAKAAELADELGIGPGYAQPLVALATAQPRSAPSVMWSHLIINASPLGMTGFPPLNIDLDFYPEGTAVFDMVYSPLETELLRAARARGCRTEGGLAMLIGQAAAAFEHFFGAIPPRADGDAALRALLTA